MQTTSKQSIRSIKVQVLADESPDTSWLGEYANEPGAEDRTIDREERGDMGRGEYRYFVAANSGEDTGNPESVEQDYQRMESLNRGAWSFVGIRAVAEVVSGQGIIQRISSAGLWGIESDSDSDMLEQTADEQIAELRAELESFGFSTKAIDKAIADADRSEV